MNQLRKKLRDFKLSGINNSLEERLQYANEKKLSYTQFLEILLDDEANNRKDNSYKKRYSKAKLPYHKTLEDFDYSFQGSIDKRVINDCATCQFISERKNIVFFGNPGTGKTHLSSAIGIKALTKGYKILFTSVGEMLQNLHFSKADNTYYQKLNHYLQPDLLILDELGFKKLPGYSADDFFEIISKRYETGSVIITSNKGFDQWADIFSDHILASAIIDRIAHHCTVIKITGQSFRTKNLKKKEGDAKDNSIH